jgi:hypothetical protein
MSFHGNKYQTFATLLEQFRSQVVSQQLDARGIQQQIMLLKQFFQQQILPLDEGPSPEQSYRTEMSKQLHLLEIDTIFFQGARQAATAAGRLTAISDRLTKLIEYCHAVTKL